MTNSKQQAPSEVPSTTTHASVLSGMRQSKDEEHRRECQARFFKLYRPLLYVFFTRRGVSNHDAEDLASDLVMRLMTSMEKFHYDPSKGRFRSYLKTVAKNALNKFWADKARHATADGGAALDQHESRDELLRRLEEQFDLDLLKEAEYRVRAKVSERDWNIYVELTTKPTKPDELAERLGIKRHTVDVAKSRVLSRINREVRKLKERGFEEA